MRKVYFSVIASLCFSFIALGENTAGKSAGPEICKFKDDKPAAISFTFDDGSYDHLTLAMPMLDKYDFKGSFYPVTHRTFDTPEEDAKMNKGKRKFVCWEEWPEFIKHGHEVGSHTVNHHHVTKLKGRELEFEVLGSQKIIAEKVGTVPETLCYPGNGWNKETKKYVEQYYLASITQGRLYYGKGFKLEKANGWIDDAVKEHKWIIAMVHGIKGYGWNPFDDEKLFDEHLAYIKKHENEVWVDTYANVSKYDKLRDNSKISVISDTPESLEFSVSTTLDTKKFNLPLTVKLPPKGTKAIAKQNGQECPVKVKGENLLIDVKPNGKAVKISWSK
jgi:peptidoglycan/xylan/chitin deacetylase (PgdA/CDA1 family)